MKWTGTWMIAALGRSCYGDTVGTGPARQCRAGGSDWPVHGLSSDFGKPMLQGTELAADEINAVGGYLGRPLQLVVKDDRGTRRPAWRRRRNWRRKGVVATIGFLQHRRGAKIPRCVPERENTAHRALRHRHAAHSQVSCARELHFPHLGARDSIQAPIRCGRHRQARLDQGRHFCRHHRLWRGRAC